MACARTAPSDSLDPDLLFDSLRGASKLLLAVSGGPDSTALLLLIDRWRKSAGVEIAVATVDHRLRPESADEARQVAKLCAARGLPHHTLVWEGASPSTRVQERARAARYSLLAACAKKLGADAILTAHHADDQAETILMRLTRGSGVTGLAGMAASSMRDGVVLARPLLGIAKADLLAVCRAEGVVAIDDPSNADAKFRRAALRDLGPTLAAQGLDGEALRRLGHRSAQAEAALIWAVSQARDLAQIARAPDRTDMSAADLAALPLDLVRRLIAEELARLAPAAPLRLERLEAMTADLAHALTVGMPFAATLAGLAVRLRGATLQITRAAPRVMRNAAAN